LNTGRCNGFYGAGDDVAFSCTQSLVEIAVGADAQTLFPNVISRCKMRLKRNAWRELFESTLFRATSSLIWESLTEFEGEKRYDEILIPDDSVSQPFWPRGDFSGEPLLERIDRGLAENIGWAALQHGHMRGLLDEIWE